MDDFYKKQLESVANSEKLNKKPPTKRPDKDRTSLCLAYEWRRMNKTREKDMFQTRTTFSTGNRHFCKKELGELKSITLNEMMVPKFHYGRYLLCRTINPATCMVGVTVAIEDLNGDVEELALYNLVKDFDMSLDDILPIGTIIAIKEPYMKYGSVGNNVAIRCDSPSDVVFLTDNSPTLVGTKWFVKYDKSSFDSLKAKGNDMFKQKRYERALEFYSKALNIEQNSVLHLNKSACLLKLERHQEAFDHACKSYSLAESDKALYRMGYSTYKMRDWNTAIQYFQKIQDVSLISKEIEDCEKRIVEATTGNYNWLQMYEQALKNDTRFDVADYIGPVKIADVPGKGKGLVATRLIRPGELLVVSKAFSISFVSECTKVFLVSANMITKRGDVNTQVVNVIDAIINLKNNPKIANDIYSLYSGSSDRSVDIPYGVVDTGLIEKICSFNTFAVDDKGILNDTGEKESATGLWLLPSFINHSCIVNTRRTFYGDVMVLFSTKTIKPDEEITLRYCDISLSVEERSKSFEKYNFVCDCRLCEMDRADKQYSQRDKLINEKKAMLVELVKQMPQVALPHLLNLVAAVKSSYATRTEMKYHLVHPMLLLAKGYDLSGNFGFYKYHHQCMTKNLKYRSNC
jgi:tetratricopeptide (TPR) repeat protein